MNYAFLIKDIFWWPQTLSKHNSHTGGVARAVFLQGVVGSVFFVRFQ